MARSRRERKKKEKSEKDKIGGLLFVSCMFVGLGVGFIFGNPPAGIMIGLGVGFAFQALVRLQDRDRMLAQERLPEEEMDTYREDVTLRQQNPNLMEEISYEDFQSGKDLD